MAEVVLIAGYCGSGKSFQARRQRADVIFDEQFGTRRVYFDTLLHLIRADVRCVVAEIKLCSGAYRAALESDLRWHMPNLMIRWICMENNLAKANRNCLERGGHIGNPQHQVWINNHVLSPVYTYHPDAEIIDVWTSCCTPLARG